MADTPVSFIIFNRPEHTARVFERIRQARPSRLFIIADGPRAGRSGETQRCAEARRIVEQGIDWPCEPVKIYADTNLGCGRRVSSGLNEVFRYVEETIILEDDCLPDPSFFPFCEELLSRYRNTSEIAQIGGFNHQYRQLEIDRSYFFSKYNHIWGWATWKRSWRLYDHEMHGWQAWCSSREFRSTICRSATRRHWRWMFRAVENGVIDSWAVRWTYQCLKNGMVTALPGVSLVENIGFGEHATHTKDANFVLPKVASIGFPLEHPSGISVNHEADAHMEEIIFSRASLLKRIARRLYKSIL